MTDLEMIIDLAYEVSSRADKLRHQTMTAPSDGTPLAIAENAARIAIGAARVHELEWVFSVCEELMQGEKEGE